MSEKQLYTQLWNDVNTRSTSSVLDRFFTDRQSSDFEAIRHAEEMVGKLQENPILYLEQANDAIAGITESNSFIANEKKMLRLLVKNTSYGMESLDNEDISFIRSLALSCPLINGSAVAKARGMYKLFAPVYVYDDIAICNQALKQESSDATVFDQENALLNARLMQSQSNRLEVYPNPARQEVNFKYALGKGQSATVSITDIYGRTSNTYQLANDRDRLTIDISQLVPGIYICNYIVDGKSQQATKLIVTR